MPDLPLSTSPPESTAYLFSAPARTPQQSAQQQQHPPDHASQGGLTASDPPTSTQQPRQLNSTSLSPSSHPVAPDSSSPDISQQGRSPRKETYTLADLPTLQTTLSSALKQYPDFPSPGILFEDILPLFADPQLHHKLLIALDLLISSSSSSSSSSVPPTVTTTNPTPPHDQSRPTPAITTTTSPDLILGLEARGFLFGPSLALSLGAGFVAVRKPGKLPGETLKAGFTKEYGKDGFEVQKDAIGRGKTVVVVDDVLATGGSAAAAGELVRQAGGVLLGYVFLLELEFLRGRDRLGGLPVKALLRSQGG